MKLHLWHLYELQRRLPTLRNLWSDAKTLLWILFPSAQKIVFEIALPCLALSAICEDEKCPEYYCLSFGKDTFISFWLTKPWPRHPCSFCNRSSLSIFLLLSIQSGDWQWCKNQLPSLFVSNIQEKCS